jgi:RecA/RadA recombinase
MDIIVVDSVSALVPRSEIEGDYGVPQVCEQKQRDTSSNGYSSCSCSSQTIKTKS